MLNSAKGGMADSTFNSKKALERNKKEQSVESKVVTYAKSKGYWSAKVTFPGHRGAADRLFIRYGDVFFIEFKRPKGGKISALQRKFYETMAEHDIDVYFCHKEEIGKQLIDARALEGLEL